MSLTRQVQRSGMPEAARAAARPPELLLGSEHYGPEIDMWSVGCIFAELLVGKPVFPGKEESNQMDRIGKLLGTPNEENMPGCSKLPWCRPRAGRPGCCYTGPCLAQRRPALVPPGTLWHSVIPCQVSPCQPIAYGCGRLANQAVDTICR